MFLAVAVVSKSIFFFSKESLVLDTMSVLVMNGRLSWIWKKVWLIQVSCCTNQLDSFSYLRFVV